MQKGLYRNDDESFEEQYRSVGIEDGRFITVVSFVFMTFLSIIASP